MKKLIVISVTLTLFAGLFSGCEKKGTPPALPPIETMTIDFSEFIGGTKSATFAPNNGNKAIENTNWSNAATIAGIWNLVVAVNIALPVASFNLAVSNTPVYTDNKTWEWNYSVAALGSTYKARLTGQIRSNDIKWEMNISKEGIGAYQEFTWFEGTSALDGKSGQWILKHSQQYQEPMLQIDWTVTGSTVGNIRYTYIRELNNNRVSDTFKGSYIEYGITTGTLNAFYNVHVNISGTANDFEEVNIEWSTSAHNGHIKAPCYYVDSLWHCWDGNGNDVTCN